MSQPSKHLFEAFKASAASAPSPAARAASAASTPSLFDGAHKPHAIALQASQVKLLLAVVVLALVCAFVLGRASVAGVGASDKTTELASETPTDATRQAAAPDFVPAAAPANANLDREARTPAETALLDARNLYTIKLLEYSPSETNKARALETLRYLTEQAGLPACITSTPKRIVVLVGAAPEQRDLDQLLRSCKTIAGPPPLSKPAEFSDAYVDKIDKLFSRKP